MTKESFLTFKKDDFTFVELIGKGSFGQVHRCIHNASGTTLAIKIIDLEKAEDDIDDIQREIQIMGQCICPNITKYYSSKIVGSSLWILMEYLGGGSTFDLLQLGPLEEVYIATISREVLKGLVYLHDEFKIHRDIKSANILLSDAGNVKLADFGVAGQISDTFQKRNTFVGTPFWMAPEVIKQANYDFKADIWSLGITVYELAMGHPPHHELHPMKALFVICKENSPELPPHFSKLIRDFLSSCLNKEPDFRPTAKTLLKHKYVKTAKKPAILIDLIDKLRLSRLTKVDLVEAMANEKAAAAEQQAPDWVFETIKLTNKMSLIVGDDQYEIKKKEQEVDSKKIVSDCPTEDLEPKKVVSNLSSEKTNSKGKKNSLGNSFNKSSNLKKRSSHNSSEKSLFSLHSSKSNSKSTEKFLEIVNNLSMQNPELSEHIKILLQNITVKPENPGIFYDTVSKLSKSKKYEI